MNNNYNEKKDQNNGGNRSDRREDGRDVQDQDQKETTSWSAPLRPNNNIDSEDREE